MREGLIVVLVLEAEGNTVLEAAVSDLPPRRLRVSRQRCACDPDDVKRILNQRRVAEQALLIILKGSKKVSRAVRDRVITGR